MKHAKKIYAIVFLTIFIFNILGLNYLINGGSAEKPYELHKIPLVSSQCELFNGMYINHTLSTTLAGNGNSSYTYTQNSNTSFHVQWFATNVGLTAWDVSSNNRVIANSSGVLPPGNGNHDHTWIFTNVSLGTLIQLSNHGLGDLTCNVSGESTVFLAGHGLVDVWVLDDTGASSTQLWYEKNYGVLLNGSFDLGFDTFTYDFMDTNIIFQTNSYTPYLTTENVSPLTGDQTTQFNFSVVYNDQDNNTPFYVNVLINNTPYEMEPQNPSDKNYTDGCLYQYLTTLQPGTYNYSFECSDGLYTNSTGTYTGLNVTSTLNLNPPVLNNGQVNPVAGFNSSTIFTFSVNYSDTDNSAPIYVNITIDTTTTTMNKSNPGDSNYVDGCIYELTTTLANLGTYNFYFNCSDANYTASFGPLIGPVVNKTQLFDGMYINHAFTSSILGDTSTTFLYSYFGGGIYNVAWLGQGMTWDVDVSDRIISNVVGAFFSSGSHTPAWIHNTVSLGDTVQIASILEAEHTWNVSADLTYLLPGFGMIEIWVLEDLTTPGGLAWYEKSTGILLNGTFVFMGSFDYNFDFNNTNADFTYVTNDYAPELTSGTVVPLNGNQTTLFNFSVIYTDQDNNFPLYINVLINGTPYPMAKQNSNDTDYTDGCVYQYPTFLQPGLYNYSFQCADWNSTNSTPTYTGINVTSLNLNAPVLSDGQVDPGVGYNSSTIFVFRVNYSDIDNSAPVSVNITINTTTSSMNQENPLDSDYRDGCWYTYNTTLINLGTYNYYFNCSDSNYTASFGPITGPLVQKTQLFDGMYTNHTITSSTLGNGPSSFLYSYFGSGIYNLTWVGWGENWDEDVTDRVISNVVGVGWFSSGDHSPAWINNTVALGDLVPIGVVLENDHIFNVSGETSIYLPNYGSIDIWILEDLTTPGGLLWYEKQSGILLNGTFYFFATFTYTFDFVDTNALINDYTPELTSGSVVPLTGNTTTLFNFSVLYTDQDNNPPISINVLINGTPYPMTQQNPFDLNYTDGCWYEYLPNLQQGLYNYSFECSDWKFSNSTSTYFGINVSFVNAYSPNLTNGQVYPHVGWSNSTVFTFTVNYTDADNNAPNYVNVTINGTIYSMVQQNPLDINYVDGTIFECNTTLNIGTYNYTFNCWDGNFPASDGPYFNLTVQANILHNYIMVPDWSYQWVDATPGIMASLDLIDNEAQLFNLPFAFQFYNESFNSIWVCTNGFASFVYDTDGNNVPFPSGAHPYMIAPYWDDLYAFSPSDIYVRNLTSPNRVVIEWLNYDSLFLGQIGSFEIVLFESGDIIFNYDYLDVAAGYTCGLNYGIDTSFFNSFSALNTSMDDFSILFYRTDLISPNGTQSPSTNISNLQNGDANGSIWVNGTATDNIRVQNVIVEWANTSGGAGDWSANLGSNSNWAFNNISAIDQGYWEVRVNITDLSNNSAIVNCFIYVDATPPSGFQWANTSTPLIQKLSTIWINGTYTDGNGSGIQSVTLTQSNTSGGITDWSGNVGSGNNFAYYNTSPLADNQFNDFYEIIILISDNAGNIRNVTCRVTVEIELPYGSQSPSTNISNPQRGSVIWVNGTAFDDGFGVLSVTTNGSDWSTNQGTLNSWIFYNNTPIGEGIYEIWVNVTDLANNSAIIICQVFVDNVAPSGSQWANTTTPTIQKIPSIWINGTTTDPSPSSGVVGVAIISSNTSGGITDWSANIGTNQIFTFYNLSPVADNSLGGYYEVIVSIIDNAGNQYNLTCQVTVEINPPSGSQDAATQVPTRGDANGRVWVNGTCSDLGFGMKNVTIQWSNHSGWSSNQGTLNSWAFYITSNMAGGLWEIQINVTDLANNSAIIVCYVYVDTIAPTGSQDGSTNISSPQNGAPNGFIYVNGTASDGLGVGMQNVTFAWTNTSASWSSNLGTNESWSFRNTSAISDGIWELIITLVDQVGNAQNISCYIFIDTIAPNASQTIVEQAFQTVDMNGRIWVNGSASDYGSGVRSMTITGSNHSGAIWGFGLILGTPQTYSPWTNYNLTLILDGVWEVYVNITDDASNSINFTAYITVDTSPPSGAQDAATSLAQNAPNGFIWINGTASDGLGIGLLNVTIVGTNHSGSPWSANLGSNTSWAFNNISAINEGIWAITINLIDQLGNTRNITCFVNIDTTAPTGAQDTGTQLPQTTDPSGYIWVTGIATDGVGAGMLSVTVVWTNHTGNPWSTNLGTNTSWAFNNVSAISDGFWELTVELTDLLGHSRNITCYIFVDTIAPNATQDSNTQVFQTVDLLGRIWVNGTASDINGSGLVNVWVQGSNHTGALWSINQNTNTSWSFYNTTGLSDGVWEVYVNITDIAGNSIVIICSLSVDATAPLGAQDIPTRQPQNAVNGLIWINGTAFDGTGVGLLSITIGLTNHSGSPWSANLGTNASWAFNNVSTINDGTWEIILVLTDQLGNVRLLQTYVTVDANAPQGSQDNETKSPQAIDINGLIWVNGTATDGNGTGILAITIISSNTTGGISDWSGNLGTNTSWAFNNLSSIADGIWEITINLVDLLSNSRNLTCLIFVDNAVPSGSQAPTTNASTYQETIQIWVNGTASDGTGSGLLSISVVVGVGTAPNNWSANLGSNSSWAFTNTSSIPIDMTYWISINITDQVGNQFLLNCTFRVELHPPQGAQDAATVIPQNAVGGYIWINGTAFDGGSGVKNVSITNTNCSATFTNNLGDNSTWAFLNASVIADGVWGITITIFDNAGHSFNVSGIIIVDTIVPTQPSNLSGVNTIGFQVVLTWSAATDNTTITYYIYRNSINIGNETTLAFIDTVPSAGTYIYYIVPVDAAGNVGPQSTNQTVVVTGASPPGGDLLIYFILIGVGLAALAVVVVATRRRKKAPRPQRRPLPREVIERPAVPKDTVSKEEVLTKEEGKALLEAALKEKSQETPKKVDLNFFLIEGEKEIEAPDVTLEVSEAQAKIPEMKKEVIKPEIKEEVTKPKMVHFTFYCTSCKKWYGLKEFAQVDCPVCNESLKLSYYCPTCEKRYTVKEPKVYNCPRCKTTKLVP